MGDAIAAGPPALVACGLPGRPGHLCPVSQRRDDGTCRASHQVLRWAQVAQRRGRDLGRGALQRDKAALVPHHPGGPGGMSQQEQGHRVCWTSRDTVTPRPPGWMGRQGRPPAAEALPLSPGVVARSAGCWAHGAPRSGWTKGRRTRPLSPAEQGLLVLPPSPWSSWVLCDLLGAPSGVPHPLEVLLCSPTQKAGWQGLRSHHPSGWPHPSSWF